MSLHPEIAAVLAGERRWAVIHGECVSTGARPEGVDWGLRDVLATMPERSVDHVITDPPYEAEAHTKQRRLIHSYNGERVAELAPLSFEPMRPEERAAVGPALAQAAIRWILVFCQVEAAMLWRDSIGARYIRTCAFVKPDGQPQLSGDRPGQGWEAIVVEHAKGQPCRWNGGGRIGVFDHVRHREGQLRNPHPTMKPLPLMMELVELFTDPGETILDPYCGSGTTGVAALRLGRRFIGIERDPKHHQTAVERLRAEENGSTLAASRAGQTALFGRVG